MPETTDELRLETTAGCIPVNRYVISQRGLRAVVLYWYQTPRRAVAGEWQAKFWLVADALRDHRTDTALVRVIAWSEAGGDGAATTTAVEFARSLYPHLRQCLPGERRLPERQSRQTKLEDWRNKSALF
jgi:EpsI family protein